MQRIRTETRRKISACPGPVLLMAYGEWTRKHGKVMNKIKMIGIDHSKASVAYRELFSFTKTSATAAMETLEEKKGVSGCII